MNFNETVKAVMVSYTSGRPLMIHGAPGAGKSDAVKEAARRLGMEHEGFTLTDIRLPTMEPAMLRGLEKISADDNTVQAIPDFLPKTGPGILVLEEFGACTPAMQVAAYELLLDRRIGQYTLPEGVIVVATGNRKQDRAVASTMSTAAATRMMNITTATDPVEWLQWGAENGIAPEVLAFIKYCPELLSEDPKVAAKDKHNVFGNARSWHVTSDTLQAFSDDECATAFAREMYNGTVGEGAGTQFGGFIKLFAHLPTLESVVMSPDSAPVPSKGDAKLACAAMLAKRATAKNLAAIFKYMERLDPELTSFFVSVALKREPKLTNTKAFTTWAAAHPDIAA